MNGRVKIKVFHASFFMDTTACHHEIHILNALSMFHNSATPLFYCYL